MKTLFVTARKLVDKNSKVCVLFIDEIDNMWCERQNSTNGSIEVKILAPIRTPPTEFFTELGGLTSSNYDNK